MWSICSSKQLISDQRNPSVAQKCDNLIAYFLRLMISKFNRKYLKIRSEQTSFYQRWIHDYNFVSTSIACFVLQTRKNYGENYKLRRIWSTSTWNTPGWPGKIYMQAGSPESFFFSPELTHSCKRQPVWACLSLYMYFVEYR